MSSGLLGLPAVYWWLWSGMLVNRLGGGVFPFLPLYLTRVCGLSPAMAGVVIGLYGVGGMVAGPVGGAMADRVGRRSTLLVASTAAAAAMLGLGAARGALALAVGATVVGFFTDLARPPLQAAVADVVPAADRTRAYGLLYWAINLGFAAAATLAGRFAAWSYSLLFIVDAATTLVFAALVYLRVPETRPARDPVASPAGTFLRQMAVPFRDRAFLVFAAIQAPVLLVFLQLTAFQLDMGAHGLSLTTVGLVLALNGVVIVVLQPLAVRHFARTPHASILAAGALLTGGGFGIAALAGGAPVYVVSVVVLTMGEIGFSMATPVFLTDLAPAHQRGGYLGANQVLWCLAAATAPGLGSLVLGRFGPRPLWLGCLVVGAAAAVLHRGITGSLTRGRTTS
jgi:MFS family permease